MKKSLLAAAITLAAAPAFAEIDPIVIYKTSPLGLNDRQTAQAITVITREQIETSGVQSVTEALNLAPGVSFNFPATRNHQGKVRLAGAKSEQILVIIDGIALSDGRNGYPDLSVIDLNSVESIELVRGNATAQLGEGAVAGAIVITTQEAKGSGTEVAGAIGTFGTRTGRISQSLTTSKGVKLYGAIYGTTSDGFNVKPTGTDTDKDGFEDKGAQLKIAAPLALGITSFSVNQNSGEYEYDVGVNEFDNLAVSGALDMGNLISRLSYAKNEKKAADSNTQTYVLKQTQAEIQYRQTEFRLVGLKLLRENTDGSSLSNGKNSDSVAIYAEQLWTRDETNVHAAARVVNNTDWDTNSALTLSVSGANERFSPFVNLGTAFRAPTELDVNGYDSNNDGDKDDTGDIPGASNLKVERSKDLEIGFRAKSTNLSARLGLRVSKLLNEIKTGSDYPGYEAPAKNSDGETKRYGHDLDINYRQELVSHSLSLSRSVREDEDGVQQSILPEYSATYNAETSFAGINWTAGARYESKRTKTHSKSASYTVGSLGASKWINGSLQLSVNVQNLFDRNYQITNGYQAPRRSTTLAAKYRF